MRAREILLVLLASLAVSSTASAQPVDDASRSAARSIGQEALDLFDKGDYAGALERFDKALAIVQVPTLGVRAARSLEKLGRWVEASERYRQVGGMTLDPNAPPAFRVKQIEAQAEAAREREALLPRIPVIEVALEGATAAEIALQIDGKPVPTALLGAKIPVDPGKHHVEASRGDQKATGDATLAEGRSQRILLRFDTAPPAAQVAPPVQPVGPQRREPLVPIAEGDRGSARRTLGFVALGVGAAGLAAGGVTWLVARGKDEDLKGLGCDDVGCPPAVGQEPIDSFDAWKAASTALLVGGVVVAAGGVILVLTAPSSSRSKAARAWLARSGRLGYLGTL